MTAADVDDVETPDEWLLAEFDQRSEFDASNFIRPVFSLHNDHPDATCQIGPTGVCRWQRTDARWPDPYRFADLDFQERNAA